MQQPREIKELQKLIESKRKMAFRDAGEAPPELRNNIEMAKNAAKEELLALLKELDQAVTAQGFVVGLMGTEARGKLFIDTLAEAVEKPVCPADKDACYRMIAQPVWESMGQRTGTPGATEVALAIGGLRTVAVELGITEFQRPDFARLTAVYIPNFATLLHEIKNIMRAAAGDELAAMYIHRQAVNFVTDTKFTGQQLLVLTPGATVDLLGALAAKFTMQPGTIDLSNDEPITKASVVKLLSAVKKAAKK